MSTLQNTSPFVLVYAGLKAFCILNWMRSSIHFLSIAIDKQPIMLCILGEKKVCISSLRMHDARYWLDGASVS
jgi:hypothetical protein